MDIVQWSQSHKGSQGSQRVKSDCGLKKLSLRHCGRDLQSQALGYPSFGMILSFILAANDERMHHYQRGRASITGFGLYLRKIIETGQLVVVAWRGLSTCSALVIL